MNRADIYKKNSGARSRAMANPWTSLPPQCVVLPIGRFASSCGLTPATRSSAALVQWFLFSVAVWPALLLDAWAPLQTIAAANATAAAEAARDTSGSLAPSWRARASALLRAGCSARHARTTTAQERHACNRVVECTVPETDDLVTALREAPTPKTKVQTTDLIWRLFARSQASHEGGTCRMEWEWPTLLTDAARYR